MSVLKEVLAYLSLAQIIASVIYMVVTAGFGTPYKDALRHYPELVAIQESSSRKRKSVYFVAVLAAAAALAALRPLRG